MWLESAFHRSGNRVGGWVRVPGERRSGGRRLRSRTRRVCGCGRWCERSRLCWSEVCGRCLGRGVRLDPGPKQRARCSRRCCWRGFRGRDRLGYLSRLRGVERRVWRHVSKSKMGKAGLLTRCHCRRYSYSLVSLYALGAVGDLRTLVHRYHCLSGAADWEIEVLATWKGFHAAHPSRLPAQSFQGRLHAA